jgi:hypothetical protein
MAIPKRSELMTVLETLHQVLESFPEDRLRQILDYARFLSWAEEREDWQQFGRLQLARAYGPDEPEYTEADLKRKGSPS